MDPNNLPPTVELPTCPPWCVTDHAALRAQSWSRDQYAGTDPLSGSPERHESPCRTPYRGGQACAAIGWRDHSDSEDLVLLTIYGIVTEYDMTPSQARELAAGLLAVADELDPPRDCPAWCTEPHDRVDAARGANTPRVHLARSVLVSDDGGENEVSVEFSQRDGADTCSISVGAFPGNLAPEVASALTDLGKG